LLEWKVDWKVEKLKSQRVIWFFDFDQMSVENWNFGFSVHLFWSWTKENEQSSHEIAIVKSGSVSDSDPMEILFFFSKKKKKKKKKKKAGWLKNINSKILWTDKIHSNLSFTLKDSIVVVDFIPQFVFELDWNPSMIERIQKETHKNNKNKKNKTK